MSFIWGYFQQKFHDPPTSQLQTDGRTDKQDFIEIPLQGVQGQTIKIWKSEFT